MAVENSQRDSRTCLAPSEIEALVSGKLPAANFPAVLGHITYCEACRTALRAAGYDELVSPATLAASADTGVAQRAADQQAEIATTKEQVVDVRPNPGSANRKDYPYLGPPQAPDELGRLGQYRVLRLLGRGGMGTVFEAEDSVLQRRVAVKVLRPEGLDESSRQRFLQEAQLAASLHSDRIVTIYQVGEDHGCPYIVMELLAGESLETRLKREPRLPVAQALRIGREVAEGLAVAHEKGLVHRDIKPPNVWLESTRTEASGFRVKLLDFGIARPIHAESRLTEEGMIVGTPSYMCPEQACGVPLDGRSDLFSLGILIYAMLAGDSPFRRSNTMLSIRAVAEEDAPPILDKLPELSPEVSGLIQRLLQKYPADRPASASEVVDQIRVLEQKLKPADQVLTTLSSPPLQPTLQTPPMTLHWSTHVTRKLPRLGRGGVAGLLAVVAAAVIGLWIEFHRFTNSTEQRPSATEAELAGSAQAPSAGQPAERSFDASAAPPVKGPRSDLPPIKVGILHSFSGPMAASEGPVADATRLAIAEINAAGGVLGGRRIEPITRDGKSYDDIFAQQALDLITREHVVTLFGVWRSGCRKAVEDVCEKYDQLLVYPRGYEGLEQSPYVIYMGGAPNQQIIPAVGWAYAAQGKRKFFLIGTDGVFSYAANEIVKDTLKNLVGGSIVGEEYRRLDDKDFMPVVEKLKQSGADIVINSVSGTGNIALFAALRKAGVKPAQVPIVSYDVSEEELSTLSARGGDLAGDYACWSYFQSLPGEANRKFIERFRERYGPTRSINDPMAAAYAGVHLWALAVNAAKSDRPADIRRSMLLQTYDAPEGPVSIDRKNQHAIRMARIGEVTKDLEFDVVWMSPKPILPVPFPPTRTRQEWEQLLRSMRDNWNGNWSPDSVLPSNTP